MTIINATPHTIHIHTESGVVVLAPSIPAPRVSSTRVTLAPIDGIPVDKTSFGEVTGLPAPVDGTFLVVSAMVASACPHRTDLLVPGEAVRDAEGKVTGCKGLSRMS